MVIGDTNWEPTRYDIGWTANMLDTLTTQASWAVPLSQSVFFINKEDQTYSLTIGNREDENNKRIIKVLKILGYTESRKS